MPGGVNGRTANLRCADSKGEAAPISRKCWHGTQPYAADAEAAPARTFICPVDTV
jgi:hypothetical protein